MSSAEAVRHGWFVIPGVQTGDRTFEDQAAGLEPAFLEAAGKTVLDIGCAEGLISYEFARRGAIVNGTDSVADHIVVAQRFVGELPCSFRVEHLDHDVLKHDLWPKRRWDIVAALGVLHKLWHPKKGVQWVARACSDLLLIRTSKRYTDDMIVSKRDSAISVQVSPILMKEGFVLEKVVQGSRRFEEDVQYWRRQR